MTKSIKKIIMLVSLIAILLVTLTACSASQRVPVPQEMLGTWVGLGHHTLPSEMLDQKEIAMMLMIDDKGSIAGYIGDATIQKTTLQKTAWWLRLIGKEKYRAAIRLSGDIVQHESFHRDGGTLFFDKISQDNLVCRFTSVGSQVNSKNMALPLVDIELRHPEQDQRNK
jgi:hypothetical protein